MQTTFKEQIDAIAKMMLTRARKVKRLGGDPSKDHTWKALNDAGSTIASVQLSPSPESVAIKAKSDSLI